MTNEVIEERREWKKIKEKKRERELSSIITFLRTPNFYPRHLYHSNHVFKEGSALYVCIIKIVTDKTLIKKTIFEIWYLVPCPTAPIFAAALPWKRRVKRFACVSMSVNERITRHFRCTYPCRTMYVACFFIPTDKLQWISSFDCRFINRFLC